MFEKLKSLFGGKEEPQHVALSDYSLMQVDMHSHLIPGIDDGSKSMEDTISLLKSFEQFGFKKVITTPHVMADGYTNSTATILSGRDAVREAMKANGINLQFDAAAEYNIDESLYPKIEQKDLLPIARNFVLVEMPFLAKPNIMGDIVYKLQTAGYNVILAHPERYPYYYDQTFKSYYSLKDRNLFFQINIASLIGTYGKGAKYTAQRMINEHMVDFVGSDLHGARHIELLKEALSLKYLERILTYDKLLNKTLL